MYTINRLAALSVLQALWTSCVHGYALSPADPTITEAPEVNLLLQERQDSSGFCTQWTITGFGAPQCPAGMTCKFQDTTSGYAGCFSSQETRVYFTTTCYDYPTSWPGTHSPLNDLYCPSANPSCGQLRFVDASGTWINFGCGTTSFFDNAIATSLVGNTLLGGAAASSTAIINNSPSQTPTSTDPASQPASGGGSSSSSSSSLNVALIVGVVIGAVAGIALLVGALILLCCIRRQRRRNREAQGASIAAQHAPPTTKAPPTFAPPVEYKSPAAEVNPTTLVSPHC